MAKILVTSTTDSISASLGDYFEGNGGFIQIDQGTWRKGIISFKKHANFILVDIVGEKSWLVSNVEDLSNKILKIDQVGGVPPNDFDDLYTKLAALIA